MNFAKIFEEVENLHGCQFAALFQVIQLKKLHSFTFFHITLYPWEQRTESPVSSKSLLPTSWISCGDKTLSVRVW